MENEKAVTLDKTLPFWLYIRMRFASFQAGSLENDSLVEGGVDKMLHRSVRVLLLVVFALSLVPAFAADLTEEEAIVVAKDALTGEAIAFEDAVITYDKDNQKWIGWGEVVVNNPDDPNYGNLPAGILDEKKYHTVYFDFEETKRNDIWVFVDADTGSVLTVYEVK